MSYQFIVIVLNEERRQHMNQMFKTLNDKVNEVNIHYLEASTVENSKEYIGQYSNKECFKFICCARSHIRALNYGVKSKYDFSIILEDDVIFYNNNFINAIEELISNWDLYSSVNYETISIGWIPLRNYSFFSELSSRFPLLKSIPNMKLFHQYLNPGTQGYIVKNSTIQTYIDYIFQPTFMDFYRKIITHPNIIKNSKIHKLNLLDINDFLSIDTYLHYIFETVTVFPPLVIESSIDSTLGYDNIVRYWPKFYKNYAIEKTNYFTEEYMEPLLISYCNDNTNSNTKTFISTLDTHNWNYHILGHGEPWINFVETRMKGYLNYLKRITNPKQIVILSDARDVFCIRNPYYFVRDFKKYQKKIVVSMELFAEGSMSYNPNQTYEQVVWIENYWNLYNIDYSKVIRKFVNGGLLCGYAEDLITCFQWIIDNNYYDDQKGLGAYVNTFPDIVYADIYADLLHTSGAFLGAGTIDKNIQNQDSVTFLELTGVKPYFLHLPGLEFISAQRFVYDEIKKTLHSLNQVKKIEMFDPIHKKILL